MRPPRFLWVPFELGRPLGVPDNAAFQRRVLLAALRLLEAEDGPVLEDFLEDAPDGTPNMSETVHPVLLSHDNNATETDLAAQLQQEIVQLEPWYERAVATQGRTTVGLSGLTPQEAGQFLVRLLDTDLPQSYRDGLSLGEALKLASEDLKAYYLEAATAQTGARPSRTAGNWFWRQTTAGQLHRTLHKRCEQSPDASLRSIARRALVPRSQI
jgi:hypothetical protein